MGDHFAAFTFVDRITEFAPGTRARGLFSIPGGIHEFPSCLVAEAVGQLAAWVAMNQVDYRGRPVAALATETRFYGDVQPGDTLELGVDIEDCDDDAVAYGGWARVNGARVIELFHCLGPMLPLENFDSPDALRKHFEVLRGGGSPEGRFEGVEAPAAVVTEHVPGRSARASLHVPTHARFFADHFPRNPVFPATLLLDSQIRLAKKLAAETFGANVVPVRMTHVKMRSFITPGQQVEIEAKLTPQDVSAGRIGLRANVDGKTVATARVEFAARVT